jgi:RHS repeat-associated protein
MIYKNKIGPVTVRQSYSARVAFLALFAFCKCLCAQDAGVSVDTSQKGLLPAGVYSLAGIEAIDQVSGNVHLNIPLASLPKGRAGSSFALALTYNSNLLEANYSWITSDKLPPPGYTLQASLYAGPGWLYNFNYGLEEGTRPANPGGGGGNCTDPTSYKIYQMFWHTPDGARHLLRPYGYSDNNGDGYYGIDPNGVNHVCAQTTQETGNLVYSTDDGTYVRVILPINASDQWGNQQWQAILPDGTTITGMANQTTVISDRNNNAITISNVYNSNDVLSETQFTDQEGRTITLAYSYGTNTETDTITESWEPSAQWTVNWEELAASGPTGYYGCTQPGDQCPANIDFLGVTSISFRVPTTGNPNYTNLSYTFGYSNTNGGWGALNSVTYPSGATASYTFAGDGSGRNFGPDLLDYPVSTKTLTHVDTADGTSTPISDVWHYQYYVSSQLCSYAVNQVTAPDGGVTTTCFFPYQNQAISYKGNVYKTVQPTGESIDSLWEFNRPYNDAAVGPNMYLKTQVRSIAHAGTPTKSAITDYLYDKNGNIASKTEYDWQPYSNLTFGAFQRLAGFSAGGSTRAESDSYQTPAATAGTGSETISDNANAYWNPAAPNLLQLQTRSAITGQGPGSVLEHTYDSRGNVTEERQWNSTLSSSPTTPLTASDASLTDMVYDSYGNTTQVTDPNRLITSYTYDGNSVYPNKKVEASGTSVARTTSYSFDPSTGLLSSQTDVNNNVETAYTYDFLGRITLVQEASNVSGLTRSTATSYEDGNRRIVVCRDLATSGDLALVNVTDYDEAGRVALTRQMETPACSSPDDDTAGIKVQNRYLYSGSNRYELTSNPYRAQTSTLASSEQTMGWTVTEYDQDNRVISSQSFDGSGLPAPWGQNTHMFGTISTLYDASGGQLTQVTDQANNVRQTVTDGLGRLVQVLEDPGTSPHLNYTTAYTYDALGDLTGVGQSGQTRTFAYDSLKRLSSATNPESGMTTYTYDGDGNLLTKKDAGSILTCFGAIGGGVCSNSGYDALNRPTMKSYSDSTPTVQYTYDQGSYGVGRLSKLQNANASTTYGYDGLGRITSSTQTTLNSYSFTYGYNMAGSLTSETYPSGRVITTSYDGANRPFQVLGTGKTYVTGPSGQSGQPANQAGIAYAAQGDYAQMSFGNGLAQVFSYNPRLQPSEFTYTQSGQSNYLLDLKTYWGVNATQNESNNGNLQSVLEQTYNGANLQTMINTYTSYNYDGANRLIGANDNNWSRSFGYDAYGNTWVTGWTTIMPNSLTPSASNSYNANNQLTGANVAYYPSGSQKTFGVNTMTYDAENRQISVTNTNPGMQATYLYDGDGERVTKAIVGGSTTLYVYDAMGRLAAEYASGDASAPPCATCYLSWDHLGSTRLVTDQSDSVVARHDYLPFGEEIQSGVGGRTSVWGASDLVTQKFTGKERDQESGLDYFGARYYGSALARYTSPDEPFADQRSIDPQSWNLYTYAANNPLKYIDKTGKAIELAGDDEQRKKQLEALQNAVGKKASSYLYDNAEKDKDGNLTGRHFVGILGGGPSGKGPDFASINSASADVAGVVANTQIAQIHLMDAGQGFIYNGATGAATSLDSNRTGLTSPFNVPAPIQIWLLDPSSAQYNDLPGYAMSNGQAGQRSLPDNEMHELGHAAWQMDIKGGRQVNPNDPNGNNRALKFENDTRRLRGGAERTEH